MAEDFSLYSPMARNPMGLPNRPRMPTVGLPGGGLTNPPPMGLKPPQGIGQGFGRPFMPSYGQGNQQQGFPETPQENLLKELLGILRKRRKIQEISQGMGGSIL